MQGIIAPIKKHSNLDLDDGTNPHSTTKTDVGLGNADNTSDADKPISTATQTALDAKISADGSVTTHNDVTSAGSGEIITTTERTKLNGIEGGAEVNNISDSQANTLTNGLEEADGLHLHERIIEFNSLTYVIVSQSQGIRLGITQDIVVIDPTSNNIDVNSNKIINVANPTNDNDATNKQYVESKILKLSNTVITDINTNAGVNFSGFNTTALINDFGSDVTIANDSITFNFTGRVRCDFNFFLTTTSPRANVLFRWRINNQDQLGRSAHNYIRSASGHNESSSCLSEIFDVTNGDVLQIRCTRLAAAGTVTVPASESLFQIERLVK